VARNAGIEEESEMTAFNIVRFRLKPGYEQQFIAEHLALRPTFQGYIGGNLIRTGDNAYCIVGEWRSFDSLAAARPQMIAFLDGVRHMLEDLGGGLGVTDPVSGEVVAKVRGASAPRKRPVRKARNATRKATKRKATKKAPKKGASKTAKKAAKKRRR